MITISYVIPTYNNLHLLKRCLSSILPQLEKDDKIIIVDDGSEDGTFEFVTTHYKMENILIVRQKNAGSGAARNKGIAMSNTEFLWFVDSDDFLIEGSSKKAKEILNTEGYDLLFFDYIIKEDDKERVEKVNLNPKIKSEMFLTIHYPWNKIISKQLFESVKFPEEKINYEDHATIPVIISRAEHIGYESDTYYYYDFNHPNNISKLTEKNDDMYIAFANLIRYRDEGYLKNEELDLLFIQTFIYTQLFNTPSMKFKDVYFNSFKVKKYLTECFPEWRTSPYITFDFVKHHHQVLSNLRIKVTVGIMFKYNILSTSLLIYSLRVVKLATKKMGQ
ncbi:MAG: glycosyltransferase family 2 protein [Alkalibacterium sp.]|nr:glycosyltransferase family 2 protein [Alkalibacterium sp.]